MWIMVFGPNTSIETINIVSVFVKADLNGACELSGPSFNLIPCEDPEHGETE